MSWSSDAQRLCLRAVGEPLGVRVPKIKTRLSLTDNLIIWSKRRDSNPRSPVPETGAIPPSLRLEINNLTLRVENWKLFYITRFIEFVLLFRSNALNLPKVLWIWKPIKFDYFSTAMKLITQYSDEYYNILIRVCQTIFQNSLLLFKYFFKFFQM